MKLGFRGIGEHVKDFEEAQSDIENWDPSYFIALSPIIRLNFRVKIKAMDNIGRVFL